MNHHLCFNAQRSPLPCLMPSHNGFGWLSSLWSGRFSSLTDSTFSLTRRSSDDSMMISGASGADFPLATNVRESPIVPSGDCAEASNGYLAEKFACMRELSTEKPGGSG